MPRDILCRGEVLQVEAVAIDLLIPLPIMPRGAGIDDAVGNPFMEMHRCSHARARAEAIASRGCSTGSETGLGVSIPGTGSDFWGSKEGGRAGLIKAVTGNQLKAVEWSKCRKPWGTG